MDWKPIDSAPKDGSNIFVWEGERMTVARWEQDDYGNKGFVTGYFIQSPEWVFPTHWMDLPEPPTSAKGIGS